MRVNVTARHRRPAIELQTDADIRWASRHLWYVSHDGEAEIRLLRTHRSDPARVNISLGPSQRQSQGQTSTRFAVARGCWAWALTFHLRRAAEQLARLLAQWQSHSRLGPTLTIPA